MTVDKPLDLRVADALDRLDLTGARDWFKALTMFGAEHPATLGCIENGLLAEIYGPTVHAQPSPNGLSWQVWVAPRGPLAGAWSKVSDAASKAEALVCALEAAPA